jgi:hypothetical protein
MKCPEFFERQCSLKDALSVIKSVKQRIAKLREVDIFSEIFTESEVLVGNTKASTSEINFDSKKREKRVPVSMKDYVVFEKLPCNTSNNDNEPSQMRQLHFEVIDLVITQLDERFCENEELLNSISSFEPLNRVSETMQSAAAGTSSSPIETSSKWKCK